MKNQNQTSDGIKRDAVISPCGRYRYLLTRRWADGPVATFCMLNPSTADAGKDDATIRRCVGFAKQWRLAGIRVVNLFAFRATDPKDMLCASDPVGPENATYLVNAAKDAKLDGTGVICAWGPKAWNKKILPAAAQMARLLRDGCGNSLYSLGLTKYGHPRHPLMLSSSAKLEHF